jgi:hypothetical protein
MMRLSKSIEKEKSNTTQKAPITTTLLQIALLLELRNGCERPSGEVSKLFKDHSLSSEAAFMV